MLRQLRLAATTLAAALVLASCGGDHDQTKQASTPRQVQASPSVDIVFQAWDIYGTLHRSGKWVGKQPVVVNFWGTWCPPCRREIPDLVRLYKEYLSKDVEIIGFAVRDTPGKVSRYTEQAQMGWVMLMADKDLLDLFGIKSVPTTIFYDHTGRQVARFVGAKTYDELKPYFDAITAR
jgi:thiol-disulfide isomerase/thioredoxin